MTANIRPAVEGDLPALLDMGARFFAEAGWSDMAAWDADSVEATLRHLIGHDDGLLLVAEVSAGRPVGMAGGLLHPFYFNLGHRTGQELFWWVEPGLRRGTGAALLAALERAARDAGAVTWTMITVAGLRSDALERLYRRRGYRPAERTYIRRF